MRVILRTSVLLLFLIPITSGILAQPANDDCAAAFPVVYSSSEQSVVLTDGDSRGATASTTPLIGSCSGSFFTDDTWYSFTTPAILPNGYVVIRGYFGNGPVTDVPAIGMALYASCGPTETAIQCFSSAVATDDRMQIPAVCLQANHTYALRVWSTGASSATEGTFRIGVYSKLFAPDHILWVDRFDSNPFTRDWTTFGICAIEQDSSKNAVWAYLPDGSIQPGAFTPATTITSESFCNGAVGVNSDFNDNWGDPALVGTGPVPTALNATGSQSNPATYVIQTPAIFTGDWNVPGVSVVFDQALRSLNSTFSLSFRNKNPGDANWTTWVDFPINLEVVANADPTFNTVRQVLPDALERDSLQIKVTYLAHYYYWMIDDFKIIETECTNTRVQSNFFAIAPFAKIPADQVYPFAALADIYNAGSCPQTNVSLNLTIENTETNEVVYDENLGYGTVKSDSLAQNKLFPDLVVLPKKTADYIGTYHLSQDSTDYDASDNLISFPFSVGYDTFALENGSTRSVAVNNTLYTAGAPLSYAYGNIFMPVTDTEVDYVSWGVNNATEMAGKTVSIYLLEWQDTNGDKIAESGERTFVGVKDYTFSGTEGDNVIIDTELDNFDNPGAAVNMEGGKIYMVVVEYVASLSTDPQFFLLSSDDHDYSAQELAMDSAVAKGIAQDPLYFTVLGFSPDGNIANIDYEVKELNVNDTRIFFGNNIVPLIRVVQKHKVNTKDQLPSKNLVTLYPNPVSDVINVKMEFKKPLQDIQLRLLNHIGQIVFTKTISTTFAYHIESINVSALAVGNYLLQVETTEGQRSIPVMVVR